VGTTQFPIQWGPKNTQFYAVPKSRTRGALPPLLVCVLPLRIRLRCVVLNLILGTFCRFSLPLRFSYDGFERELSGEDFDPLNYFTIFNMDLYIRTHTHVYVYMYTYIYTYICMYVYIYIYTWCNRRNGPDCGRVFLMLYYTDITQNTYIQS